MNVARVRTLRSAVHSGDGVGARYGMAPRRAA
jgi:hypothetical protein